MKERRPVTRRFFLTALLLLSLTGFAFAQSPSAPEKPENAVTETPVPARAAVSRTVQPRLASGINLFSQGKWQEAVLEFRRLQAEAPSAEIRGEAFFWIGLAELSAGEYEAALADMAALEEADPQSRRLTELGYHKGRALYYLGRYDEAIVEFNGYAENLLPGPDGILSAADTSRKAAALFWTGESLFALGQMEKSADVFRLIIDNYPGSAKYEASVYRVALINQKKVEAELLNLLKLSHEESLRNTEEYRQRESSYDQAVSAYQKKIAEMQTDTRVQDLEDENTRYRTQLDSAEERIRSLENALLETSSSLEKSEAAASLEKLKQLKTSAEEIESILLRDGK